MQFFKKFIIHVIIITTINFMAVAFMKNQLKISKSLLASQPLLKTLKPEQIDNLIPTLNFIQKNKGEIVIRQSQVSPGIYIVLKGRLKVASPGPNDTESGFSYINQNSFFGELSIIDGKASNVNVEAVEETLLLLIPAKNCIEFLSSSPSFTYSILAKLASSLRFTNVRFQMLREKGENRIRLYFASIAEQQTSKGMTGIMPKHDEIAGMTNLTRETVSRTISKLKQAGIIEIFKDQERTLFLIRNS